MQDGRIVCGPHYERAPDGTLGMLEVLLSRGMPSEDKLESLGSKYGIMVTTDVRNEMGKMCDLGAYLVEEGKAEGRSEGRADERRQFVEVAARTVRADGCLRPPSAWHASSGHWASPGTAS